MSSRRVTIEKIRRLIYGEQPNDDAEITVGLVNQWLNDAIGAASKKNYVDNIKIDGVGYVNNSFYKSFKDLPVTSEGYQTYKVALPSVPISVGANEGLASLTFTDGVNLSYDAIPLTTNQVSYTRGRRQIPNKLLYWYEGGDVFAQSATLDLTQFTAKARMVSAGDSSDLDSPMSIPDDVMPEIVEYVKAQLAFMRGQPQDLQNDGRDGVDGR